MTKNELAAGITERLMADDLLNLFDYNNDTETIKRLTTEIIEYGLRDYLVIAGNAEIVIG